MREWQSSSKIAKFLQRNGFKIEWGTAGLPAAFIATFVQGSGGPVLGFNGEYDALPGLSQTKGSGQHDPLIYNYDAYGPTYGPGHGDAHNCLGAATAGAAIATARALQRHNLNATVKYFGSSGEEQLVGKAYAVRAGAYRGLDVFLDWHPGPTTDASWVPLATLTSATFSFLGAAGHGGSPLGNKSGLDGALLMAHMTEYLRQNNVAPSARLHYAIINGGGGPNVAPDLCSIWYYVREGSPERTKILYDKVVTCAQAAASASQTKLTYRMNTAIWNTIGNKAGGRTRFRQHADHRPADRQCSGRRVREGAATRTRAAGRRFAAGHCPAAAAEPDLHRWPIFGRRRCQLEHPRIGFFAAIWPPGIPFHNWSTTGCAITLSRTRVCSPQPAISRRPRSIW